MSFFCEEPLLLYSLWADISESFSICNTDQGSFAQSHKMLVEERHQKLICHVTVVLSLNKTVLKDGYKYSFFFFLPLSAYFLKLH